MSMLDALLGNAPTSPNPLRSGLVGGMFGVGHTGGNILGILGDSLLALGGDKPVYQPRLEQARAGQALQGFASDPMGAIQRYAQIDAPGAADLAIKYNNEQSDDEERKVRQQYYADQHRSAVDQRNMAYLGAANENTYPQIKQNITADYAKENVPMPFDLPDKWDPEGIRSAMMGGGVKAKDQFGLYQTGQKIDQNNQKIAETNRHHLADEALGDNRVVEAGRHNQADEGLRDQSNTENTRHDQVTEGQGATKIAMNPNNPANKSKQVMTSTGPATVNSAGDRMVQTDKNGKRRLFVKEGMTPDGRRIWKLAQ